MSKSNNSIQTTEEESVFEEYILGVRIVEFTTSEGDGPRYRFEAPEHTEISFEDPEMATLYADVYFCTNGFQEAGTGERGVPPEIIGAGRAVLASYMLTQPDNDLNWVASFFGLKPYRVERYVSNVEERAEDIRNGAMERGLE